MEICDKAKEIVNTGNQERLNNLDILLRSCESPVEQILLAALYNRWLPDIDPSRRVLTWQFQANYPAWDGIFLACCEMQRTIATLSDGQYRVDFCIYLTRFNHRESVSGEQNSYYPELGRLIVEVDGHEFHDRTKRQASYDRMRDRELTLEGYRIVRFTGSDVYNNAESCAEDIEYHINALASDVLQTYMDKGELGDLILGRPANQ